MGSGKDFEDALMDSLEAWVGDDGYPLLRKQQMASRRGQFQMGQEMDILVDSAQDDYYIGLEAKSRNTDNGLGMYFSKLNPEQFLGQDEYREVSGRTVLVAVELRNCCGDDDCAFLLSLDLFLDKIREDATKVSWEEVREYGAYLGSDQDLEFSAAHIDYAEARYALDQETNRDTDEDHDNELPQAPMRHEPRGNE